VLHEVAMADNSPAIIAFGRQFGFPRDLRRDRPLPFCASGVETSTPTWGLILADALSFISRGSDLAQA
jgi:hypothetical protein